MFPSFTGSSRKPRNINLSGRKSAPGSAQRTSVLSKAPSHSTSLINAQQERAQREAERTRLKSTITIQRVWRGRKAAELQRENWRSEWDALFSAGMGKSWKDEPERVVWGITVFLGFYTRGLRKTNRKKESDLQRMGVLVYCVRDCFQSKEGLSGVSDEKRLHFLLWGFGKVLIEALNEPLVRRDILNLLPWLGGRIPGIVDVKYYKALSANTTISESLPAELLAAILNPLRQSTTDGEVYSNFIVNYLTTPELPSLLGKEGFERLRDGVDLSGLTKVFGGRDLPLEQIPSEGRIWLLSYIINFSRNPSKNAIIDLTASDEDTCKNEEEWAYIRITSLLLTSVASEVGKRMGIEDVSMNQADDSEDEDTIYGTKQPLPPFVKTELESLIERSSVSDLLSRTRASQDDARVLARFALTLLLVFPARRQDIQMWLCLAKTSDGVPAVRYFWQAVKKTKLFTDIARDLRVAVESLKLRSSNSNSTTQASDEDEWNTILVFLELYSFLLVVMNDDEFFSSTGDSKERQLPLKEVEKLSVFLKNLAFAMYWSGREILGENKTKDTDGEIFFKEQRENRGWEVQYLKEVATGLLRMLYTRDSRRRFLRKGHWLMTDPFDMEGFIPAVVQEEEKRHQMEKEDPLDPIALAAMHPQERRNIQLERLKKKRRLQERNNYLAAITPRLEILQNLPFFIPFPTRVQIFREFVLVDQRRRRGGLIDPDQWRAAVLQRSRRVSQPIQGVYLQGHDRIIRQHATIRRNRVFEDAYEQFWGLEEGLKEPIQITFVDRFGGEEAGIDGGGVTKEFLTGVCGEAFRPSAPPNPGAKAAEAEDDKEADEGSFFGSSLFLENDQRLLYPNPTSIDELKDELRMKHQFPIEEIDEHAKELLKRYEFLGRVVGKCLYEGILVDVAFAPFFLLKWSQPPSSTSAQQSVGINDLRDLDEDLYRGLVNLKNYNGDVESDFGLNFTTSFRLRNSEKVITVNLKSDGDKIPVTNSNRLDYIHSVSRFRLSLQPFRQTSSFLRGLNSIINPAWLSMFNTSELQTLVGGDITTPIDVEDLRKNTVYGGLYQVGDDGVEHESVQLFWGVMRGLNDTERRKVLKFVTSVARAPLLGFGVLRPKFSIRDAGEDQGRLCSASTCVNLLKLPRYKDPNVLREKLLYSVNSNAGFDLS